jgi:hypothetical protein
MLFTIGLRKKVSGLSQEIGRGPKSFEDRAGSYLRRVEDNADASFPIADHLRPIRILIFGHSGRRAATRE